MAKKMKMENEDRISDLPDSILIVILSFLSTREAVASSMLSSRWKYLFTFVGNLDFDFDDYRSNAKKPKINNFKCFVDRMLFFHNTTSVDKFRLKCGRRVDAICFQRWMSAAVWRGVKHLDLNIFVPKFTASPAVLLTCRTLVTLKLDTHLFDFVLNNSNRICLPNLKTLHLKHLKSKEFPNDDSVKSLVSGCISLEDLVMEYCTMNKIDISHKLLKRLTILSSKRCSSVAIDTPALAYFKYIDRIARTYSLKNLESLVRADIEFVIKDNDLDNFFSVTAFATAFFGGIIDNVQSLNLSFTSLKLLIDGCKPLPIFPKLVHLRICDDSQRCYCSSRMVLANVLTNSDELEELAFNQTALFNLPEKVPFCILYKLRVIEISELDAHTYSLWKVKYFLENARVLQKLTIRTGLISEGERLKISEELLNCPRQSKKCCILIN